MLVIPDSMKTVLMVIIIPLCIFLFSCEKTEFEEAAEEYGNIMIDSYKKSQVAPNKGKEISDQIQGMMGTPLDPSVYDYDPETGEIFIRDSQFSRPEESP